MHAGIFTLRKVGVWILFGLVWVLAIGITTPISASTWTQRFPSTSPPINSFPAMAYDAARGETVLFGGLYGPSSFDETWIWNGTTWTQKFPSANPGKRHKHAMVYDAARGEVVLFGGSNGTTYLNDTWVWDGNTWIQRTPANSPPARYWHAMVYDAAREDVVLFGGNNGNTYFDDTWAWNGTTWTQKSPVSHPSKRHGHSVVYDAARGYALLFGGYDGTNYFDDSWAWDGTTWTQLFPAASPQARDNYAMVYDAASNEVVLFGGCCYWNDTWVWNGTSWRQEFPDIAPSPRDDVAMVYDTARHETVLFAGCCSFNDTWVWTGSTPYLFDGFQDGIMDWNVIRGQWQESENSLRGTAKRLAIAFAPLPWVPSGVWGCSTCTIVTDMQTAGGEGSRVYLVGWFADTKNYVELLMNEESNKWVLKQRSSGKVVAKARARDFIRPGVRYQVQLNYDGSQFTLWIGGRTVLTMTAATQPFGNIGFKVKNTAGTFGQVVVY